MKSPGGSTGGMAVHRNDSYNPQSLLSFLEDLLMVTSFKSNNLLDYNSCDFNINMDVPSNILASAFLTSSPPLILFSSLS